MKATAVTGGIRYTELVCETDYLSTNKHQHRGPAAAKTDSSSWCIERDLEAEEFCWAVVGPACCKDRNGNIWYVKRQDSRLASLGTVDEKIALFQAPSNELNDWHGHPRGHRGRDDYPDIGTLRAMKAHGLINNVEYTRMRTGVIP